MNIHDYLDQAHVEPDTCPRCHEFLLQDEECGCAGDPAHDPHPVSEVSQLYNDFWKELVETDGKIDPVKVANELFDYYAVLGEVAKVYDQATGGRITKQNTSAEYVIEAIEDHYEALWNP